MTATDGTAGDDKAVAAPPAATAFILAGGEMAALMASADWSATGVGPIATWSQSLKTLIRILVTSRYAMWVGWGEEMTFFYNDAYAPTLGVKHPWALGQPASKVWAEIWPDIGPRARTVIETGIATWDEGLLLFLQRSGFPEETYHTFSYSPVPDDDGRIAGMLCVVTEETQRVIGERRVATLRDLSGELSAVRTEPDMLDAVGRSLERNAHDLPFTAIYLSDPETGALRLANTTGGIGTVLAPAVIEHPTDLPWPAASVLAGEESRALWDVRGMGGLTAGTWDTPPRQVVIVPIAQQGAQQGATRAAGLLIAAVNPYRPFDEAYAGFVDLLAAQIASGLASARAYEAERRRAEALAEIDQAKTAFFSNISHEFRTPLTLMLGPLEEEIASLDALSAARLSMVHRNGLRLLRLVNTLLDFSRIEAGRVQARFRPIDLGRYTEDLASNFRSACEQAGLRLETACAGLPGAVYVDPDMWERIVLNLVSNAFKYTLAGGITVALAGDGDQAVLRVRDTGIGIPPAELPRIFDRFHRIEGQRGRTMEGTGIGLALVSELVRLHGGSVRVESEVNEGTTVIVALPFGRSHLPADNVSETLEQGDHDSVAAAAFVEEALRWLPEPAAALTTVDSSSSLASLGIDGTVPAEARRRILLADDNADMRDYVTGLLRQGYDVIPARDGQEALLWARTTQPDLILSDVMMPRLDGFGLLQAVRDDPALRDLPFILLSARAGEEARLEGLDAGADDYLVKPFSARELLARVRSNLDLARLRREARDALQQANERLEQRVTEEIGKRTQAEESLRQSQKMEAIGHLTGGVAHDFNNLLTVIGGGVETLQRMLGTVALGKEATRINRALSMIEQGSQRAAMLTHRLLAFARRQTLDPKPIDANKLVAGMSELLRRTLGERVALETVLAGGLWRTEADANQLESAVLNLAVNARDAMPAGGKLTIETANAHLDAAYATKHAEVVPGQYVLVVVSDTGTGMDGATLERVFEPFFTTKDVGHGTGLGLSQVYGFIKQSSGHVKLYSEPGQGTSVKLYLPRLLGERPEPPPLCHDAVIPTGRGETVLVVEDEPTVREHSVSTLRDLGYRVVAAEDAHVALRLLADDATIRLLFTDVGLPGGMTGAQLALAARRHRPDLRVVYTTGYARNAIVHGGVLDPGTELLPKPFSYADLAAKIRGALDA